MSRMPSQSRGGQWANQAFSGETLVTIREAQGSLFGPLAILTAILFGSAVAIAFGLNAVLVIFLVIRNESEELGVEISRLPAYCALFLGLSAVSGAAMYSLLKNLSWQWRAQTGMWLSVVVTAAFIWLRNYY